jgi:hypothetical protein
MLTLDSADSILTLDIIHLLVPPKSLGHHVICDAIPLVILEIVSTIAHSVHIC